VFGKDAFEVTKNERIGYLPEESYLYKFLTAEETLDFYGRLFDMPAAILETKRKLCSFCQRSDAARAKRLLYQSTILKNRNFL
jgi:ABC-2 type transport system ATP-binding protein